MPVDISTFLDEAEKAEEMLERAKYKCTHWEIISPMFQVGLLAYAMERALNRFIRRTIVQGCTTRKYDASEAVEILLAIEAGIREVEVTAYTNLMLRQEWENGTGNIVAQRRVARVVTDVNDVPLLENNRVKYKITMSQIVPGSLSWDHVGEEVRKLSDVNRSFRKYPVHGGYTADAVGIAVINHVKVDRDLILDILDWHENLQREAIPLRFDAVEFLPVEITTHGISGQTCPSANDPCSCCMCNCNAFTGGRQTITCGWIYSCAIIVSCCGCRTCPSPPPTCGCNSCSPACTKYTCQYNGAHPSTAEWYCQ